MTYPCRLPFMKICYNHKIRDNIAEKDGYYFVTFSDLKKPKESQFLGACLVRVKSIYDVCSLCWDLGINPGGEMTIAKIPYTKALNFNTDKINLLITDGVTLQAFLDTILN